MSCTAPRMAVCDTVQRVHAMRCEIRHRNVCSAVVRAARVRALTRQALERRQLMTPTETEAELMKLTKCNFITARSVPSKTASFSVLLPRTLISPQKQRKGRAVQDGFGSFCGLQRFDSFSSLESRVNPCSFPVSRRRTLAEHDCDLDKACEALQGDVF